MTARLAAANTPHARSGHERRVMRNAVAGMADGLDDVVAQLGAQAADADVDDVGSRVEGVAPDLLEQLRRPQVRPALASRCLRTRNSRAVSGIGPAPRSAVRRCESSVSPPAWTPPSPSRPLPSRRRAHTRATSSAKAKGLTR